MRLARPALRLEEQLSAADAAELALRARRGFVAGQILSAGFDVDLLRLEPDPRHKTGAVGAAAAFAMAVTAEARRETRDERHPAAMAAAVTFGRDVVFAHVFGLGT